MRILMLLLIATAFLPAANAQTPLANTSWKGQAMAPKEVTIILNFTADSVFMYITPQMFIGETMAYTVKDNTFTWRKVRGNSPCDTLATGTYTFVIKGDELAFKIVTEDCPARKVAWTGQPFKRVANPGE